LMYMSALIAIVPASYSSDGSHIIAPGKQDSAEVGADFQKICQ